MDGLSVEVMVPRQVGIIYDYYYYRLLQWKVLFRMYTYILKDHLYLLVL